MSKSLVLVIAVTGLIGLTAFYLPYTSVFATQSGQDQRPQGEQAHRGGLSGGEGMMFRLVDLTSEQKDQIKKLHNTENEAAKSIHDQLKTIHEQLQAATKDGAFNESVVRSLLARTQQPELELEVLHIKTRTAIFNVLTPAQKTRFTELRAKIEKNYDGPPPPRD